MRKVNSAGLDAALAALRELGIEVEARADAIISVARDGKAFRFRADVKPRPAPALLGPLALAASEAGAEHLLITDYVTPPMADALRLRGIQFVDAAGNAFLDRKGLFVFVTGRKPKTRTQQPKAVRVFRRSGLQVLFALLSEPRLVSEPQRTIAHAANVSLGSVAATLDGLRALGAMATVRGTPRLVDRERLIDQWTEGYLRVLEPTLDLGRFASVDLRRRTFNAAKYDGQWSGETAAARLGENLQPEQTIVYVDEIRSRLLADARLKRDANGDVRIRRRFWNAVPSPRKDVVPALLIYADLLATGDARSLDAAKDIRRRYLD